jgi:hypothetical protein
MTDQKTFSFIRPTIETPYHIDFDWWKNHDSNWHIFLISCLCAEHQKLFQENPEFQIIDRVDPVTAEVQQVDGIQSVLMDHCVKEPGYLNQNSTLVDSIFRVFLSNGNQPLSPKILSDKIGKPPDLILRTLSGATVFKGIRPYH